MNRGRLDLLSRNRCILLPPSQRRTTQGFLWKVVQSLHRSRGLSSHHSGHSQRPDQIAKTRKAGAALTHTRDVGGLASIWPFDRCLPLYGDDLADERKSSFSDPKRTRFSILTNHGRPMLPPSSSLSASAGFRPTDSTPSAASAASSGPCLWHIAVTNCASEDSTSPQAICWAESAFYGLHWHQTVLGDGSFMEEWLSHKPVRRFTSPTNTTTTTEADMIQQAWDPLRHSTRHGSRPRCMTTSDPWH